MKLRSRILLLALVLCFVFGLVLSGVMLRGAFQRNLRAELERGLQASDMFAASLKAGMEALSSKDDREGVQRAVRVTAAYMTDLALVAVIDVQEQLIYDNFSQSSAPMMEMAPRTAGYYSVLSFQGSAYQLICREVVTGQGRMKLLYAWLLEPVFQAAREETRSAAVLLILLCGLLALTLLLSLRAVFQPMRRLEEAAQKLGQGDYGARTRIVHPDDEVGQLSKRFNDMAEATQRHVEELTAQEVSQRQFIADMAHEMKTPLTSMIGFADLLRRSELGMEQREQALHAIVMQGERLERMSFKLLYLARLNGGLAPEMKMEKAEELILEATQAMTDALREKHVHLEISVGDESWYCDRDLIVTLISNLLSNAVKASEVGQCIRLLSKPEGFSVIDEGSGIAPEHLPYITRAFYMADKSRAHSQQGAGLGLALCHRISELHGAILSFESELGKGTCASLTFTSS